MDERRAEKDVGMARADEVPAASRSRVVPCSNGRPSFQQQRMWFLHAMDATKSANNAPIGWRLVGPLDVASLGQAFATICDRHEVLRTRFREDEEGVHTHVEPRASELLMTEVPESELRGAILEEVARPFDLANDAPARARLFRVTAESHVLVITTHHIATDGWSLSVLATELTALYRARNTDSASDLPFPRMQYAEFAAWQRHWVATSERAAEQIAYWRERLRGAPTRPLRLDPLPDAATALLPMGRQRFRIGADAVGRGRALLAKERATLFMLLVAVFDAVLARHGGESDITVGTLLAGRPRSELEPLIGFFVNVAALRVEVDPRASFRALLRAVKGVTLDAYAHQELPFERVVEELQLPRASAQRRLFQVMIALQNAPAAGLALDGVAVAIEEMPRFDPGADLMLRAWTGAQGTLEATLEYDPRSFRSETISRLAEHVAIFFDAAVSRPDDAVDTLPLISDDERRRLVVELNATEHALADPRPVHRVFEDQARRTPDAIALSHCGEHLTYRELDERSNQLAHLLVARGSAPGRPVAVCMDRSLDMVMALYAILKSGGAYAPLDPGHPAERLELLVRDLEAPFALVSRTTAGALAGAGLPLLVVEDAVTADLPTTPPDVEARGEDPAYVIYTSGSTGQPKGVVSIHAGLSNRLQWMQAEYRLTSADAVLQKTPYTFDVSVWELFWPLMFGARLVVAEPDAHKDPSYLVTTIRNEGITTLHFVPSMLAIFLEEPAAPECTTLRQVFASGEALTVALRDRFFERLPCRLHNLYGPTEASIDVSYWECVRDERPYLPIGRPIWNTQLYVVNAANEPAPFGVAGELCIGGVGLARGYWKQPALSEERFVPDPFAAEPGARMYRTGDLACWQPDGVLEYLGRIDHQVKLRGMRIELGEIECAIALVEGVRSAVVVLRRDAADERLVAYLEPATVDVALVEATLRRKLPDHMVPSAFVALDALPLTTSGKVDRRALPEPSRTPAPALAPAVTPRDATERALVDVFERVLRTSNVGIEDDFFALGGHSLLAMRAVARIRTVLAMDVPVRWLFDAPTVAKLAARLAEAAPSARLGAITIPRVARGVAQPVSFAQSRLWFLDQYEPGSATYNVPVAVELEGLVDAAVLERVLQALVDRHEALRTTYGAGPSEPLQTVRETAAVMLTRVTVASEEEARAVIGREVHAPFDLATGPLLRMALVTLSPVQHRLVLCMHHIATDGWSFGILFDEASRLYEAFAAGRPSPLAPLAIDYLDFAVWQRGWLDGPFRQSELAFWKKELDGAPVALEMPTDFPRSAVRRSVGDVVQFRLPEATAEGLRALCRREGVTPFMILLAAYQSVLSRWSGQRDIVIGTPIANRTSEALESIVGFFVNTLPLRCSFDSDETFLDLVRRVKRTALAAYAHQHLPFEKLVEDLNVPRDLSRTPVFQAFFAMQNMARGRLQLPGVTVRDGNPEFKVSKLDLWLTIAENDDGFHGFVVYDVALFERATAQRIVDHFTTLLAGALGAPETRIDELPLLTERERSLVVDQWNATDTDDDPSLCVHELFAARASRSPDAIATADVRTRLTYRELDERAERVAGWLAERGVGPGARVAISLERSVDMVAAVLGVLKSGAAYVPLDPEFPEDRREFMRSDADCSVDLTAESLAEALTHERSAARSARARPDDLAYVLYTSGSTGRPKGVLIEHRSLVAFLQAMQRAPGLTADDVLVSVTTLSFDIAGLELYLPLITGASVVIASREVASDPRALAALLDRNRATVMQATPATWRMLLADRWRPTRRLKMLCGGEAITPELVSALTAEGAELWNMYGPTETTIWSTCIRLLREGPISIGRPIANTRVYVLDRHGRPTPIGVPGELHIGGRGVARGYHGRADLTAERFLPDPFSAIAGARMYATGDLARWRADGTIEYLGRLDQQVKVRGYRIELGEIESVLAAHPAVAQVAVVVRGDAENKSIVAYVVAETDPDDARQRELHDEQLRGWEATWELHYGEASGIDDPTFNVAGWLSSYTGEPIPPSEMREWLGHTIAWARRLAPRRVLEIGVGTGMVLFGVAPGTESYWGFDLSQIALRYIEQNLAAAHGPEIRLEHRAADRIADVAPGARDTVILNSVIQYFPSAPYLTEVLTHAVRVVGPGGTVRIGDVRSAVLLEAFHASVLLARADDGMAVPALAESVRRAVRREKELAVDPRYFVELARELGTIAHVEVEPKRGSYDNELSRFRYDVTLHVGPPEPRSAVGSARPIAWPGSVATLQEQLAASTEPQVLVCAIPNARTEAHVALALDLRSADARGTVEDLRGGVAGRAPPAAAVHPDALRELGRTLGFRVDLTWAAGRPRGELDAVFTRNGPHAAAAARAALTALADPAGVPLGQLANSPIQHGFERTLAPRLQSFLKEKLPDYMVPSAFVMLEQLPLTPNGKVDRKALPAPDFALAASAYEAPRTPTESALAAVWQELLGVERVGINDDFFALGGHSLLATRCASRIHEELGVSVPVRVLFQAPTVARLAEHLRGLVQRPERASITRAAERTHGPLSSNQQLWWRRHLERPESPRFIYVEAYRLGGELEPEALAACIDEEFARHDALRTAIELVGDEPIQRVHEPRAGVLERLDLRGEPPEAILALQAKERQRREQVGTIGPARAILARLAEDEHRLILAFHRVTMDPLLAGAFMIEVMAAYDARVAGRPSPLPAPEVQYLDFVAWQGQLLQTAQASERIASCARRLANVAAVDLPFDHPSPAEVTTKARPVNLELGPAFWSAVGDLARDESTTKFVVLSALFKAWLSVLTKQDAIVIIAPNELARGQHATLARTFGCFFNYFVLLTDLSGDLSLREAIRREHVVVLDAYENVEVPSVLVMDPGDAGPLCRAALNFVPELDAWNVKSSSGLSIELVGVGPPHRIVDFAWLVFGERGFLAISHDKFEQATATRLGAEFNAFLRRALAAPDSSFASLPAS